MLATLDAFIECESKSNFRMDASTFRWLWDLEAKSRRPNKRSVVIGETSNIPFLDIQQGISGLKSLLFSVNEKSMWNPRWHI
jgi:hypothetical protein